jgi:superfamily II DNA/RNA helicase
MLIFTSAIATARDLRAAIPNAGTMTSRGMQPIDALDAFRRGRIDTLICTDLASEGLNLQRAGVVVHYDIPWNPVKLDQRNGRAWRIGQTRDAVEAIYFIPDSRRTRIIATVASKNRTRRRFGTRLRHPAQPRPARPPISPRPAPAADPPPSRSAASGSATGRALSRRRRAPFSRCRASTSTSAARDLLALLECEIIDGCGSADRR